MAEGQVTRICHQEKIWLKDGGGEYTIMENMTEGQGDRSDSQQVHKTLSIISTSKDWNLLSMSHEWKIPSSREDTISIINPLDPDDVANTSWKNLGSCLGDVNMSSTGQVGCCPGDMNCRHE